MHSDMEPIIEATNLRKAFGGLVAVDGLSFLVQSGECFGILGPNGAGKTTTIRMIYGFSPMTAGDMRVFGMDIRRRYRAVKSRIGVCQQENNLDPDLTVIQNLEVYAGFFNVPRREARRRALELLSFMSLEKRPGTPALELSGGVERPPGDAPGAHHHPGPPVSEGPPAGRGGAAGGRGGRAGRPRPTRGRRAPRAPGARRTPGGPRRR